MEPLTASTTEENNMMAGDKEVSHVEHGNSETVNDTLDPVVGENFGIDKSTAAKLNSDADIDVGKTVVENKSETDENLCSRISSDSTSTLTSSNNNNINNNNSSSSNNSIKSGSPSESAVCNSENNLNSSKVSLNDDVVSDNSGNSNGETAEPATTICEQSTAEVSEDNSKQDENGKADAISNEPVGQTENPAVDASEERLNDSVAGGSGNDVNVDEGGLLKDNDATVVASEKLSQSTAAPISDVDVSDSDVATDDKQQKILSENDASNKDLCDDSNTSTAVGRDQEDSSQPFGEDETSLNLSESGACSGSESEHRTERTRFLHCDDTVSQYDDNMDTNEANAVDPFAQTTEELEKTTNETSDEPMDVDGIAEQNKDVDNVEMAQANMTEMDVTEIAAKGENKPEETQHMDTEDTPDKAEVSDSEKNKTCSDSDGKTDDEVVKENKESDEAEKISDEADKISDEAGKISDEADKISDEADKISDEADKISDEADKISDEAKKDDSAMETEVDTTSDRKKDEVVTDKDGDKAKDDSESGDKTNDVAVAEKPLNSGEPLETGGDEDVCIIPDTVPRVPSESEETINNKLRSILNKEATTDYQASGRPQRQAAKTANAQIKATVHQLNEFEGEKENEEEGENSAPSIGSADVKSTQQNQQACQQCCRKRVCKFKILSQGKVLSYLCSETCTNKYQENINQHMQASRAKKEAEKKDDPSKGTAASADDDKLPDKGADSTGDPSQTESDSTITVNDVEEIAAIASETVKEKDSSGGVASVSASMKRPTRRVNDDGEFVRICSECSTDIKQDERTLSWETMDFCNEGCLGKYQTSLGSHCSYCKKSVQQISLGKYCVRFGYDIRQFCCASCLEEFKKGLKVCSYCQKDISSSVEGFLAPVGDKGQFKDFCTQECMEKYDQMSTNHRPPPETYPCDVCKNKKLVQVQVLMESKVNKLCSEVCFAAFKFVNTIKVDQCDMCRKYFDRANVSTENFSIYYDDAQHNFCCKTCMNVYILAKRKIVPCNWCKVKKYNFDMIKRIQENNKQVLMMCSLNCLTLYQVSVNAVSSRRIKCDSCSQVSQAQYHLTMSDATIRNFCNYNCVMKFQGQYSKSPITLPGTPIPTGVPKRVIPSSPVNNSTVATLPVSNDVSGVPVISSVTSLAGQNGSHVPSDGSTAGGAKQLNSVQMMNGPGSGTPVPISLTTATTPVSAAPGGVGPIVHSSSGAGTPSPYHVIVKPAQPTKVSNKLVQCRPYMHTKGVSCRPHASAKHTQTEEEYVPDGQKVFIPIPVPIYVPVPMHMYTLPTPVPMPVPLPVPVPVFIPTTRGSAKGIMNEIKKIQEKIPADPFEAELLMMAEMVAEQKKQEETSDSDDDDNVDAGSPGSPGGASPSRSASATAQTGGPDVSASSGGGGDAVGGGGGNAAAFTSGETIEATSSNAFGTEDMLQMALKMATEMDDQSNSSSAANAAVDLEAELPPNTIAAQIRPNHTDGENEEDVDDPEPVMRESRGRKRAGRPPGSGGGRRSTSGSASTPPVKRTRKSSTVVVEPPPPPPVIQIPVEKPDANMCLKFTFGVNAWKQWVNAKNVELERTNATAAPNKKMKLFKTDILQLTADELNYALCLFVKEARKPNGTTYAPDTIYYFCLGIQQYLFENGRIDNIFTDTYYEKFTDCLDEVAKVFSEISDDSKLIVTRVEEEHLWESKQLGAHSPHVLLSTLMFFNTKHFNLTSVEEHMQLSFSHIMKHWKRNTNPPGPVPGGGANSNKVAPGSRNVLLRFYPPQSALDANAKKKKVYEQQENEDNPLRCPVKLYEFYLSKCPESVKTRNDVFYLLPERSCVPDSPVWYSTMALGKEALLKMLHRVKMVKEINIALRSA